MGANEGHRTADDAFPMQGIWRKVNFDVETAEAPSGPTLGETDAGKNIKAHAERWKRQRPICDIAGVLLWAYVFVQAFVFDIDDHVIRELPAGDAIANFKFLGFLGLLVLAVVVLSRADAIRAIAYVLLFPLVILFWRIPKLLYKTNSWVVFFSAANVVATTVMNFKASLITLGAGLFATVLILAGSSPAPLVIGMSLVAFLLLAAFYRAIRYALSPSAFLYTQSNAIERIVGSDHLTDFVNVDEELRSDDVEQFSETQQNTFLTKLSFGVLIHRILYYWAYQLDRYRRSTAPIVFSLVAFLGLLVGVVFGLTLLNEGLYGIEHNAFSYTDPPSFFVFARYAFASLYGNEISILQASSDLANALSLVSMFLGIGILGTFLLTLFNSRRERQSEAAKDTIRQIKNHGAKFERLFLENYEVSVKVAMERLERLKGLFAGVAIGISNRIPDDFDELQEIEASSETPSSPE
jgi:xanthosine utilization system XapX-like protein